MTEPLLVSQNKPLFSISIFPVNICTKSGSRVKIINSDSNLVLSFLKMIGDIESVRYTVTKRCADTFAVDINFRFIISHQPKHGIFRLFLQINSPFKPDIGVIWTFSEPGPYPLSLPIIIGTNTVVCRRYHRRQHSCQHSG